MHPAVMRRPGATRIASADRALGRFDGVTRLDPARASEREELLPR